MLKILFSPIDFPQRGRLSASPKFGIFEKKFFSRKQDCATSQNLACHDVMPMNIIIM